MASKYVNNIQASKTKKVHFNCSRKMSCVGKGRERGDVVQILLMFARRTAFLGFRCERLKKKTSQGTNICTAVSNETNVYIRTTNNDSKNVRKHTRIYNTFVHKRNNNCRKSATS